MQGDSDVLSEQGVQRCPRHAADADIALEDTVYTSVLLILLQFPLSDVRCRLDLDGQWQRGGNDALQKSAISTQKMHAGNITGIDASHWIDTERRNVASWPPADIQE